MRSLDTDSEDKATAGAGTGKLSVLLVYEDLSTGLRARRAFEETARRLASEADFNVDLWKFDLLREPVLLQWATKAAADADIIFLSAHGYGELPHAVDLWLKRWLESRGGGPCALVVLLDQEAGDNAAATQALQGLHARALAGGVEIFLQAGGTLRTQQPSTLVDVQRDAKATAIIPGESHREFERHSYRDWGINE